MKGRNFILQNFPFIEDDFDALTDYQLFSKVVEYVKRFAKDNEEFKKQLEKYENYFENLDVQEEIDNKLDEMLEDGSLSSIISMYLELQTTYGYDSLSDMKSATNLINGCYAKTLGYYSTNDGGASHYLIRTKELSDTPDDMTIIALDDETLVAELVKEDIMNPTQFGAKGDGETDDTLSINTCIDYADNILFNQGTYIINPIYDSENPDDTCINLKSDKIIDFNNATITIDSTDEMLGYIIRGYQVNNITLKNGNIIGYDETESTGADSQQMGIAIMDCSNIVIENMNISHCRGDGIYVREYSNQKKTNNVYINNCIFTDNRRNQIGYTGGKNIKITNCDFVFDVDPEETYESNWVGIDFERDHDYARFENFYINNCNFKGQPKAAISLSPVDTTVPCYGTIENCNILNCARAIQGTRGGGAGNSVYVRNINITGCTLPPISMTRGNNSMNITFENIVLNSFTYTGVEDLNYMFYMPGASGEGVSNVSIINPICKVQCPLVFMNNGINNVSIINPIFQNGQSDNSWGILHGRTGSSVLVLKDDYNQIRMTIDDDYTPSNISIPSNIIVYGQSEAIDVTIVNSLMSDGNEITVFNLGGYITNILIQNQRTVTIPPYQGYIRIIKMNGVPMFYGNLTKFENLPQE